jgi:peptidoglycan/xylan/chitin deacetylase (PgdA/CDA1 family)
MPVLRLVFALILGLTTFAGTLILPGAVAAAPPSVYFPVTGHVLSGDFLTYWRANGGLSIFGYPITEQMQQGGLQVQYFERARFEYHPEFKGTPYQVELELLGSETVQGRTETAFQPLTALPNWTDSADRLYFPATRHYLSYGFKTYWQQHGGLAIFGFPISEEFQEGGRTVQYFERARFEWWPEHRGTQYEVQLGLLGDAAASRDGVSTAAVGKPDNVPNYDTALFIELQSLRIPVLMYHQIGPNAARYVTPLAKFDQEMDWLQAQGYSSVTLSQVYDYMFNGGTLPPNPVMITFDDATAGQWDAAAALDNRGMKGTFFIITGKSALSPDQLRSLSARGDEIESHTVSHPYLTQLSDNDLAYQLSQSRSTLQAILGKPVRFIAYPYGDFNARVENATAAAGYSAGIAAWGGKDWTLSKRWDEPRVEVSGLLSTSEFAAWVR